MNFIHTTFAATSQNEDFLPSRPVGPAGEDWYVLDEAEVLSDETEATLQTRLSTLATDTGTGMVVLTIPTLNDIPIETYTLDVGRAWGVGQEEFDNGLVFLVVPEDREMRIEVGYGLEGAITDLHSSLILNKVASPHFKGGDYDQGVLESMAQLEALARGETFLPDDSQTASGDSITNLLFFMIPFVWALLSWFSNTKAWWMGGIFGGLFGFIVGAWLGLAIGAAGGLLLDYMLSTYLFAKFRGGGGSGHGGSGFSGFGGGGFGGGGASGKW